MPSNSREILENFLTPFEFERGLSDVEKERAGAVFDELVQDIMVLRESEFPTSPNGFVTKLAREEMILPDSKLWVGVLESIEVDGPKRVVDIYEYDENGQSMRHLYVHKTGMDLLRTDTNLRAQRVDHDSLKDQRADMLNRMANLYTEVQLGVNNQPIGLEEAQRLAALVRSMFG